MSVVCRLTVVAALFFIGVDSVAARHHEGDNRGDNNFGPPLILRHLRLLRDYLNRVFFQMKE